MIVVFVGGGPFAELEDFECEQFNHMVNGTAPLG
jgi:hypothetical protein